MTVPNSGYTRHGTARHTRQQCRVTTMGYASLTRSHMVISMDYIQSLRFAKNGWESSMYSTQPIRSLWPVFLCSRATSAREVFPPCGTSEWCEEASGRRWWRDVWMCGVASRWDDSTEGDLGTRKVRRITWRAASCRAANGEEMARRWVGWKCRQSGLRRLGRHGRLE